MAEKWVAWKGGVATGKSSASGSMGAIDSFGENGPTAKFRDARGPTFSHKNQQKGGPSHGGGICGSPEGFGPYKAGQQ